MKLELFDTITSSVKVLSLTARGVWLHAQGEDHFLTYESFPWFRNAVVDAVFNVEPLGSDGLRWPDLGIDLLIDSIRDSDNYPLVARH